MLISAERLHTHKFQPSCSPCLWPFSTYNAPLSKLREENGCRLESIFIMHFLHIAEATYSQILKYNSTSLDLSQSVSGKCGKIAPARILNQTWKRSEFFTSQIYLISNLIYSSCTMIKWTIIKLKSLHDLWFRKANGRLFEVERVAIFLDAFFYYYAISIEINQCLGFCLNWSIDLFWEIRCEELLGRIYCVVIHGEGWNVLGQSKVDFLFGVFLNLMIDIKIRFHWCLCKFLLNSSID